MLTSFLLEWYFLVRLIKLKIRHYDHNTLLDWKYKTKFLEISFAWDRVKLCRIVIFPITITTKHFYNSLKNWSTTCWVTYVQWLCKQTTCRKIRLKNIWYLLLFSWPNYLSRSALSWKTSQKSFFDQWDISSTESEQIWNPAKIRICFYAIHQRDYLTKLYVLFYSGTW